jgi:hypothetical protein
MFHIKNAVLVAIMQTGVIVGGVLGAGTSYKVWKTFSGLDTVPSSISLLMNLGPLALVVPPVWIASVLVLRLRPEVSDDAKSLAFTTGIIILLALGLLMGGAIITPWFGVDFGPRAGANDP